MKQSYFITGFPGFLATLLINQLVQDHEKKIAHIYLLVLPELTDQSNNKIIKFAEDHQINVDLFTIISGNITKSDLAVNKQDQLQLQSTVTHVFHLAAIYDLAVPKIDAFHVNVHGTWEVNEWVKTLTHLKRYIYFSTAYISGKREGKIYENELSKEQDFKNHYEKTKYEAEVMVNSMKNHVPITIIRPGIVKGHSKTGETTKFDGLYFILNLFDSLRFLPIIPYIGKGKPEGNFVPVDYVLEATSFLAIDPIGEGKTYHLTDPKPYTMKEIYKLLAQAYLRKTPKGKLSVSLAKKSLEKLRIRRWLQVEQEALDYFIYEASYDCSQALADLKGTDIACPDLKNTIEPMIEFYLKHKNDHAKHIKIN